MYIARSLDTRLSLAWMEAGGRGCGTWALFTGHPRRKSGLKLKQLYCVQQVMIEDKALGCENLQVFTMSCTSAFHGFIPHPLRPQVYKDVKNWCPHAHDQQFIITPRTLLPWLLAGRVWEQDDKQWKPGNEATRLVGPTYFRCLLPAFLTTTISCDVMWYHCELMWWQCVQFAKSLWPKSSSVGCLPSGEIPSSSWPWNTGRNMSTRTR